MEEKEAVSSAGGRRKENGEVGQLWQGARDENMIDWSRTIRVSAQLVTVQTLSTALHNTCVLLASYLEGVSTDDIRTRGVVAGVPRDGNVSPNRAKRVACSEAGL